MTGNSALPEIKSPQVVEAITGAIRSCLENVVKHSSSDSAEIFVDYTRKNLTVMIADYGVGFDLGAIPADRLGIRRSIVQRIETVGGNVKIWTAPDAGTSVIIEVPLDGDDE